MISMEGLRLSLEQYPGLPEEAFCSTCRKPKGDHPAVIERLTARGENIQLARAFMCQCAEVAKEDYVRRRMVAGIPVRHPPLSPYTFDTFRRRDLKAVGEARRAAAMWANGEGKPILTFAGPVGVGKSHLAGAAAQYVLDHGGRVMYREEARVFLLMRLAFNAETRGGADEIVSELCTIPWLVFDDLGLEKRSEWVDQTLSTIFLARSLGAGRLRTLVTTNAGPTEKEITKRVLDRLSEVSIAAGFEIDAPSYRIGGA